MGAQFGRDSVKKENLQTVKRALIDAGVEIYRTRADEIHIAERIRLHIMDSGIRIVFADEAKVVFSARSQRSDFPAETENALFEKVRSTVGRAASERGFSEVSANTVQVKDPVDNEKVLDVWHEVTYSRAVSDIASAVADVQWSLALEKYIST